MVDTSGKPRAWLVNRHARYPAVRPIAPALSACEPYLADSYRLRFFSNFGPASIAFEEACERMWFGEDRRAVLCSNATAGLTAALIVLDAKGVAAVPAYTFAATASAVRAAGLEPISIDIDSRTGIMCPEALLRAAAVNSFSAVIAVRPHGVWRDLGALGDVTKKIGAHLVIDNAAGIGVEKSVVDSFFVDGAIEVFSFHATKTFAIGEGGLIVVPADLQDSVRSALNFGLWEAGKLSAGQGFNGKVSEFTAALGLAAMEGYQSQRMTRLACARTYRLKMADCPEWRDLGPDDLLNSTWGGFPAIAPASQDVDRLVKAALQDGLVLRRYYYPTLPGSDCPAAEDLAARSISLPIYGDMTSRELAEAWSIFERAMAQT